MRKTPLLAISFMLFALGALGAQEFSYDSEYTVALRRAYLLAGKIFPYSSFPVTLRQLNDAAERIGYTLEYQSAASDDGVRYLFFMDAYLDSNASSDGCLVEPDAPRDGIDIQRSWYQRAPFLRVGASISGETGLLAAIEFEGRKEWGGDWFNSWNLPEYGGPGYGLLFDNQVLSRGILSWEGQNLRISLGRDPMHIGPAEVLGLYPSSLLPYLDAFRLDGKIGRFHLDWLFGGFHPIQSWEAIIDGTGGYTNDVIKVAEQWDGTAPVPIFFGLHRFQYVGERLRLSIGEEIFYARNPFFFEANDFLPVATWHGLDFYPDNMALIMDFSWAAMKGLTIHGMAGYDDISSDIFGIYDSPVPTIDAYVLAIEFDIPVADTSVSGLTQAGYTHYLWGNFDATTSSGGGWKSTEQLLLARHVARYYTDDGKGILLPFSSPYGPGALWFEASVKLKPIAEWLTLGLDLFLLSKNTDANLITTQYERSSLIEDAPRTVLVEIGLPLEARFASILGRVALGLTPSLSILGGQTSMNLDLRFGLWIGDHDGALKQY